MEWLRDEEKTGEKTIKTYMYYLPKLVGFTFKGKDDVRRAFEIMKLNKSSYEALSRLFTFVEKKLEGYEELVYKLRKAMPRKPATKADTYVPPDSEVLKLKRNIKRCGEPYITVYNIMVAGGTRIKEAYDLIKAFNLSRLVKVTSVLSDEEVYRYHLDLQRKSKNVYVVYLPRPVVEPIMRLRGSELPHLDTVEDKFRKCGLPGKYLRKWWRQMLKRLKVDPELIEFLQGRSQGIGPTHYTDFIPLADSEYINTIYPALKRFLIIDGG